MSYSEDQLFSSSLPKFILIEYGLNLENRVLVSGNKVRPIVMAEWLAKGYKISGWQRKPILTHHDNTHLDDCCWYYTDLEQSQS